jgi:hypothetical protein
MARKHFSTEQIIGMLREAEVRLSQYVALPGYSLPEKQVFYQCRSSEDEDDVQQQERCPERLIPSDIDIMESHITRSGVYWSADASHTAFGMLSKRAVGGRHSMPQCREG